VLRPDEQRGRWEDAGEQRACRRQGEALRLRSSSTVSVSQRRSGPARGPGRRRARASTGTAGTRRTAVQQTADGVTELGAGGLAMHYGLEQGENGEGRAGQLGEATGSAWNQGLDGYGCCGCGPARNEQAMQRTCARSSEEEKEIRQSRVLARGDSSGREGVGNGPGDRAQSNRMLARHRRSPDQRPTTEAATRPNMQT